MIFGLAQGYNEPASLPRILTVLAHCNNLREQLFGPIARDLS